MPFFTRDFLRNSTPSRKDGINEAKESQLRRTYVNFIKELVDILKLTSWTLETAVVFTQRFFAVRSLAKNDRFLVAAASVFLACKVEESPRSPRDVASAFMKAKNLNKPAELENIKANMETLAPPIMENIILCERALLYTLAFELHREHAAGVLGSIMEKLKMDAPIREGDPKVKVVYQAAVNLSNDSLKSTTLCLQYDVRKLAAAFAFQAMKLYDYSPPLPENTNYSDMFGISQGELEDIIEQLMEIYKPKDQQPTVALSDLLLQSAKASGPPLPTFKPVILTGATSAPIQAQAPVEMTVPSVIEPSLKPVVLLSTAGVSSSTPETVTVQGGAPGQDAPSPSDQNNNNEPAVKTQQICKDPALQQAVPTPEMEEQPGTSRKRARSPIPMEEGELTHHPKSPCLTLVSLS